MYGKNLNFLQKNNSKLSDFIKKSTTIFAQKVFTLLIFMVFLCLVSTNNVYAGSVSQSRSTEYWYKVSELSPSGQISVAVHQFTWYGYNNSETVGTADPRVGTYNFDKQLDFKAKKADGTTTTLGTSRVSMTSRYSTGSCTCNVYGGTITRNPHGQPYHLYGKTITVNTDDLINDGYVEYGVFLTINSQGENTTSINDNQSYSVPFYFKSDFSEYAEYPLDSGSKSSGDTTAGGKDFDFSSKKVDVTDYDYVKVQVSTPGCTPCFDSTLYAAWNLTLNNAADVKTNYYIKNGEYSVGSSVTASKSETKNTYIFDTRDISGYLYLDGTVNLKRAADSPDGGTTQHQHYAYAYYSIIGFGPKNPIIKDISVGGESVLSSGNLTHVNLI